MKRRYLSIPLTEQQQTQYRQAAGDVPVSRWARKILDTEITRQQKAAEKKAKR